MKRLPDPVADEADEDATTQLLQLAAPREAVPAAREARVRAALRSEWQAGVRRRSARLRTLAVGAIAAVAVAAGLVVRQLSPPVIAPADGDAAALVERIQGRPRRSPGTTAGAYLQREDIVRAGTWVETDATARVALRFAEGVSVRLDTGSRARPLSSTAIELAAGALYVDSGSERGSFEVRTAVATARDIGTQFEVRLFRDAIRLRVRTGLVELRDRRRAVSGRAGTEITLTDAGVQTRHVAANGPEWDWVAHVALPLEIEGQSLASVLDRLGREHGWTIRYANDSVAASAAAAVLHGSVAGLSFREAVEVVLATSGHPYRFEDGDLVVLQAPDEPGVGRR